MSMWTILEKNDAGKSQKIEKVEKTLEEIFIRGISFLDDESSSLVPVFVLLYCIVVVSVSCFSALCHQ